MTHPGARAAVLTMAIALVGLGVTACTSNDNGGVIVPPPATNATTTTVATTATS